eukprot:CAMPEP_0179005180 /NCGR_PEP_ID=MMETSP0795-20121207/13761_1 /TAXON_ID=88552 /ORGANISM="Amoebophrya sp., Strain Ameob2" /LENGTH=654 /DNA_ID=CAMNT_0020699613 /DNA_START=57 /DNA_END=2021 /DNA_ORIENTATION=+
MATAPIFNEQHQYDHGSSVRHDMSEETDAMLSLASSTPTRTEIGFRPQPKTVAPQEYVEPKPDQLCTTRCSSSPSASVHDEPGLQRSLLAKNQLQSCLQQQHDLHFHSSTADLATSRNYDAEERTSEAAKPRQERGSSLSKFHAFWTVVLTIVVLAVIVVLELVPREEMKHMLPTSFALPQMKLSSHTEFLAPRTRDTTKDGSCGKQDGNESESEEEAGKLGAGGTGDFFSTEGEGNGLAKSAAGNTVADSAAPSMLERTRAVANTMLKLAADPAVVHGLVNAFVQPQPGAGTAQPPAPAAAPPQAAAGQAQPQVPAGPPQPPTRAPGAAASALEVSTTRAQPQGGAGGPPPADAVSVLAPAILGALNAPAAAPPGTVPPAAPAVQQEQHFAEMQQLLDAVKAQKEKLADVMRLQATHEESELQAKRRLAEDSIHNLVDPNHPGRVDTAKLSNFLNYLEAVMDRVSKIETKVTAGIEGTHHSLEYVEQSNEYVRKLAEMVKQKTDQFEAKFNQVEEDIKITAGLGARLAGDVELVENKGDHPKAAEAEQPAASAPAGAAQAVSIKFSHRKCRAFEPKICRARKEEDEEDGLSTHALGMGFRGGRPIATAGIKEQAKGGFHKPWHGISMRRVEDDVARRHKCVRDLQIMFEEKTH